MNVFTFWDRKVSLFIWCPVGCRSQVLDSTDLCAGILDICQWLKIYSGTCLPRKVTCTMWGRFAIPSIMKTNLDSSLRPPSPKTDPESWWVLCVLETKYAFLGYYSWSFISACPQSSTLWVGHKQIVWAGTYIASWGMFSNFHANLMALRATSLCGWWFRLLEPPANGSTLWCLEFNISLE